MGANPPSAAPAPRRVRTILIATLAPLAQIPPMGIEVGR